MDPHLSSAVGDPLSDSPRPSKCRTVAVLLIALAGFAVLPSQSAATTHRAAPSAATPVNPATVSDSLKRQTGYSASQLTTKPVCGTPKPGQMSCLARILIVKRTGKPARLLQTPHASPMQVTGHGSFAAAAISADQTGTAAPQSGTAAFLQWAYDTTWLSANRGAGDTVAIIDAYDDPNAASDLAIFRSTNGLPACAVGTCFNQYDQNGQLIHQLGATGIAPKRDSTGGWEVEESLDLDAVSSLCPDCKIDLVEASSANESDLQSAAQAAHSLGASQISMSFGIDEPAGSDPETAGTWTFPGVASLAAAGDGSYPGPEVAGNTNTVGYPAAYADVTAVGGTSLTVAGTAPRGFDESTWAIGTCGGGSTCGTESGCDTSQATPSYQQSDAALIDACAQIAATAGVPNEGGRAYNDVSADADPNTGLNVYDTVGGSGGFTGWDPVGGTSLATPLTAAYEAVAGVTRTPSPTWAYNDATLLNDIVSGSDGSCPSGALLICNAGTGWDGPTGNGSINGDVAVGGPGVGGGLVSIDNADDATVGGGVYPNGAATTYSVQYATDAYYSANSAYDQQTTASSAGSAPTLQSVSTTLCGLTPNTTYHYSVAATNSFGTTDGYDNTFTTAASEALPTNITPPSISGTASEGQALSAQPGTWDVCNSTPSYQWQESRTGASGTWSDIQNATASTYTPTAADTGMYVTVAVTESNSTGGTTATASPVGPVQASPATTKPTKKSPTKSGTSTKIVRFYRCAHTCTLLKTHGATTYKPRRADDGRYIKVVTTLTRAKGKAPTVTTRWIGPITAATAGDVTLSGTAHAAAALRIKGSTATTLARVRIKKRTSRTLTLAVTRRGRTATSIWAYVIRNGAVVSCTRSHSLGRPVTLSVTATRRETVKLVAVRA